MAAPAAGAGSGSGDGSNSSLPGDGSNSSLPLIERLPKGYYFQPSNDEVLVYLKRKILGQQLPVDIIPTADVYGTAPDQLPFENSRYLREKEWYFFTTRPSHEHVMEDGYWICKEDMKIDVDGKVEGFKQELVYYNGVLGSGKITPWRIWEYRMNPYSIGSPNELSDDVKEKIATLVICKVFLKKVRASQRRRLQ